jgi:hypothetical protein
VAKRKGSMYYYVYRSTISGKYVEKWVGEAPFSKLVKKERRLRYP